MCIDCGPDCRPGEHQHQRPADSPLPPAAVDHHLHIQGPEVSAELRRRAALAPADFAIFSPALFDTRSGADAVAQLDQAGIGEGVLLSMAYTFASPRATMRDDTAAVARLTRAENHYNVAAAQASQGRLHAFIGINPVADGALEELRYWAGQDGVIGVKLHLGNSGFQPESAQHVARLSAVFAAARDHGLALVVHVRSGAAFPLSETAQFIEQILPHAGRTPVQIAHAGGGGGIDDETLAALSLYALALERGAPGTERLVIDLSVVLVRDITDAASAELVRRLVALVRRIGPQRFVMGSDWPTICSPRDHNDMQAQQMTLSEQEWRVILANRAAYLPPVVSPAATAAITGTTQP
jgi:predicted TIM-barrel fold metal-dependent hydrolase